MKECPVAYHHELYTLAMIFHPWTKLILWCLLEKKGCIRIGITVYIDDFMTYLCRYMSSVSNEGVFVYFYMDCTIFIRSDKRYCRKDYSPERMSVICNGSARVQYNKFCMNLNLQRAVELYCSYCKRANKFEKNWA